jgi:hypothetical protein
MYILNIHSDIKTVRVPLTFDEIDFSRYFNISSSELQKAHLVSATKMNRLIVFRETVAVYRENHT